MNTVQFETCFDDQQMLIEHHVFYAPSIVTKFTCPKWLEEFFLG
jgi:hypothetical protein